MMVRLSNGLVEHRYITKAELDHAVGVDVGDLCAELDQRIGEPIERAVGRYLDRQITKHIRENVVRELAEKIITYDRVVKESKV